jgi:hypothetical protein
MYHLVFGEEAASQRGSVLLGLLGFRSFDDVGRYRDAWVERGQDGRPVIAVYTRNGGGNRVCWRAEEGESCDGTCTGCVATNFLPAHPLYLRDKDDGFDSTYATFYFRPPEEWVEALAEVAGDPVDTDQRWHDAIAAIGGDSRG